MQVEDYFDFLELDDIRIKGTRIGIESILYEYIHQGQTPEAIAEHFHTVTVEQVYATILFYLENRPTVESYLADWLAFSRRARDAQAHRSHPVFDRLRELKAAQRGAMTGTQ